MTGYNFYKPNDESSKFIKSYWQLETESTTADFCHLLMPTGTVELIFYFGENSTNGINNRSTSFIAGQRNKHYYFRGINKSGLISVVLHPYIAGNVIRYPVNELSNNLIYAEEIFGNEILNVTERLEESVSFNERISILRDFIMSKIADLNILEMNRINYAVDEINRNHALISIENLANKVNLSKRQLERKFNDEIGLTPRDFIKVVRFQSVLWAKQKNKDISLTNLAYTCGYYDQAHFINDFKSVTGFTPKEYFKLAEPFSDYFSFL